MGSMATTESDRKEAKPRVEVGADEARLRLGDYLDRAAVGERIAITRHGKPARVALISIDDLEALERLESEVA